MDKEIERVSNEFAELRRKRNETYAKWSKEIALLLFAALVVQKFVSPESVASFVAVVGLVLTIGMYVLAVFFLVKSTS